MMVKASNMRRLVNYHMIYIIYMLYPICSPNKSDVRFAQFDFLMSKSDVRYANYRISSMFDLINWFKFIPTFNALSKKMKFH